MNGEGKKLGLAETDVLMVAHRLTNEAFAEWIGISSDSSEDIGYLQGVSDLTHALLKELGEITE